MALSAAGRHAEAIGAGLWHRLPTGWKTSIDGTSVLVQRSVTVTREHNLPAAGMFDKPEARVITFRLSLGPCAATGDHARAAASNRRIQAKLDRMHRNMRRYVCAAGQGDSCFTPKTRAQQQRVAKYLALRGQLVALPTEYVGEEFPVVFTFEEPGMNEVFDCADCDQVKAKLRELAQPFPR